MRKFSLGLALGLALAFAGSAVAGQLSLLTGVQETNQLSSILNTLINNINANFVTRGVALPAGQLVMTTVANGSVATAMSSVGPAGSNATVQEWMVVKNASGVSRYVPMF